MAGVEFPAGYVQTDSGAYPASYPKDRTVLSSGLKRPVHAADEMLPFGGC